MDGCIERGNGSIDSLRRQIDRPEKIAREHHLSTQ
jgi:hypothetical protein